MLSSKSVLKVYGDAVTEGSWYRAWIGIFKPEASFQMLQFALYTFYAWIGSLGSSRRKINRISCSCVLAQDRSAIFWRVVMDKCWWAEFVEGVVVLIRLCFLFWTSKYHWPSLYNLMAENGHWINQVLIHCIHFFLKASSLYFSPQ